MPLTRSAISATARKARFVIADAVAAQAIVDIAQQVGNNVVIDFQNAFNDKVILKNFALANLDTGDFVF